MNQVGKQLVVVSPEQARAEIERIIGSKTFASSARLCAFLRYLGDSYSRGETPKEHEIAVSVFGRPASFDPLNDSIVRVHAHRLRLKLMEYYATTEQSSGHELVLSKGEYSIRFLAEVAAPAPPQEIHIAETLPASKSKRWLWIVPAIAAMLAVMALLVTRKPSAPPVLQRISQKGLLAGPAKFSPDGKAAYWGAQPSFSRPSEIYTVALPGDGVGQPPVSPARLGYPGMRLYSVSPSGSLLLLHAAEEEALYVASQPGVPAEHRGKHVVAARWGPDGKSMMVVRRSGETVTLEYPAGNPLATATTSTGGSPFANAAISPSGRWIAFARVSPSPPTFDLWMLDTRDKTARVVLSSFFDVPAPVWRRDRDELALGGVRRGEDPQVYAVSPTGETKVLWRTTHLMIVEDIRKDGALLVREVVQQKRVYVQLPEANGIRELFPAGPDLNVRSMSRDGQTLLLTESKTGDQQNDVVHVWRPREPETLTRLTNGVISAISFDGAKALVTRVQGAPDARHLVVMGIGSTKEPERDVTPDGFDSKYPASWWPDGKGFFFSGDPRAGRGTRGEVSLFDRGVEAAPGSKPAEVGQNIQGFVGLGQGRAVAFQSQLRLMVREGGGDAREIGHNVMERASIVGYLSGPERVVIAETPFVGDNFLVEMKTVDLKTGTVEPWRRMEPAAGSRFEFPLAVFSADGRYFAYTANNQIRTLFLLQNLPW